MLDGIQHDGLLAKQSVVARGCKQLVMPHGMYSQLDRQVYKLLDDDILCHIFALPRSLFRLHVAASFTASPLPSFTSRNSWPARSSERHIFRTDGRLHQRGGYCGTCIAPVQSVSIPFYAWILIVGLCLFTYKMLPCSRLSH